MTILSSYAVTSGTDPDAPAPADAGPGMPTRRELTARLLLLAIGRYNEACAEADMIRARAEEIGSAWIDRFKADPFVETRAEADARNAERRAEERLAEQYEGEFASADLALALRIRALYADVAPGGVDPDLAAIEPFEECAVRHEGMLYIVGFDPQYWEEGGPYLVTTIREGRVCDVPECD